MRKCNLTWGKFNFSHQIGLALAKPLAGQGRTQNFHLGVARVETDPGWNSFPSGIRSWVEFVPGWKSFLGGVRTP